MDLLHLREGDRTHDVLYAVDCPPEAACWDVVPSAGVLYGEGQIDPQGAHPITDRSFILEIESVPHDARLGIFDADGQELPTIYPGSGSMGISGSICEPICILILLLGTGVTVVRLYCLRRKKRAAQEEAEP